MLSICVISNFQDVILFAVVEVKRHRPLKPNFSLFLYFFFMNNPEEKNFQVLHKSMLLCNFFFEIRRDHFTEHKKLKQEMDS